MAIGWQSHTHNLTPTHTVSYQAHARETDGERETEIEKIEGKSQDRLKPGLFNKTLYGFIFVSKWLFSFVRHCNAKYTTKQSSLQTHFSAHKLSFLLIKNIHVSIFTAEKDILFTDSVTSRQSERFHTRLRSTSQGKTCNILSNCYEISIPHVLWCQFRP